METIVISIGGSIITSKDIDPLFLKKLSKLLVDLTREHRIFLVVGGGNIARKYIELGRKIGLDEKKLDKIGIASTRFNAQFLTMILDKSNKDEIPEKIDDAIELSKKHDIIVMGGTTPGHSTDMVGAELAEKTKADLFIIATNVDGIYDKDPRHYKNVKKFKEIKIDDLIKIVGGTDWKKAGSNVIVDGPACEIIRRSKIKTYVINGKNIDALETLIREHKLIDGTEIKI
ncbi:uridylate kinase [Euryarchaeota archaeon ex4484_162]|nr:UMP kinase [Thermoplasmata archaeon]OYT58460.1 MAG: uridylate kinase [Euryarchaeota archaeon ex4484_162]HDM25290.1 UMP kinase [Thermoplasmatales archaeon]